VSTQRYRLPIAVQVLLLDRESVLLLRRANTGYADGLLGLPAGHLEEGESVVEAAMREAFEEVGVRLEPDALALVVTVHRRFPTGDYLHLFFAATRWSGEVANCEPSKCSGLEWHPLVRLPDGLVPEVRDAIAAYRSGRGFVETRG
jgi:8-oxo-dGTP pyrophosphatase MutT (NUDIX family)